MTVKKRLMTFAVYASIKCSVTELAEENFPGACAQTAEMKWLPALALRGQGRHGCFSRRRWIAVCCRASEYQQQHRQRGLKQDAALWGCCPARPCSARSPPPPRAPPARARPRGPGHAQLPSGWGGAPRRQPGQGASLARFSTTAPDRACPPACPQRHCGDFLLAPSLFFSLSRWQAGFLLVCWLYCSFVIPLILMSHQHYLILGIQSLLRNVCKPITHFGREWIHQPATCSTW